MGHRDSYAYIGCRNGRRCEPRALGAEDEGAPFGCVCSELLKVNGVNRIRVKCNRGESLFG